jgi:hypothetical protein
LLVTNYESLTMAAQFSDVRLPQAHEQANVIRVPAGSYDVRVVQHVDPDGDELEAGPDFSVQLTATNAPTAPWSEPRWFRRDA